MGQNQPDDLVMRILFANAGLVDAIHRAVRAWHEDERWSAVRHRGMSTDWSWTKPAQIHLDLYRNLI